MIFLQNIISFVNRVVFINRGFYPCIFKGILNYPREIIYI